jgi:AraC-like DNA-binding protein
MYQTIEPPDHLKKYIDCFWMGDAEAFPNVPNAYHSIASSKMELLFFYCGNYVSKDVNGIVQKEFKAGFYGHTTNYNHYLAATTKTSIFGIRFLPLAVLTFFNIPANELTNQKVDINTLLSGQGNELEEKIVEAKTFLEKVNIIIDFFNKRLKSLHSKYRTTENALVRIQQTKTRISIPELVSQSYLSQRQFERNFKDLSGFSAKTYLKLVRFELFIERATLIDKLNESSLTNIALDFGYYDQSHLNHHFKEFTGIAPSTYFANISSQEY